jgi:3-hydroxyisobutyrate dehydrogenase
MPTRVGFIGLGNLGVHLARSLVLAGFEVVVNDLDPSRAEHLVAEGATWGRTPRQVAEATDTVVTCLPSPAAVNAVMTGDEGVLAGFAAGGTWIEMSTNDREEIQRLALLCRAQGVNCLEAPVTGGVHRAAEGEVTVLVGGDESVYAEQTPLFAAVGNRTFFMGVLGNASIIKVITNMLAFIHLVAAGEALMLAKAGGLDLATSFEAIRASSGNSFVHETESQVVLNGSYDIGFTLDLACKDLGFATAMGADFSVPLELATLVQQTFARARSEYGGDAWSPMVVKLLEDAVGQELRAPGFPEVLGADSRHGTGERSS